MKRFFSLLLVFCLLCGCAMAAPEIAEDNYPVVDGSTATLPLSYALMQACTGCTQEEAESKITHNKTTSSFYRLVDGTADILLVYEPNQDAYDYAESEGVELEQAVIGRDALVFLVNDTNAVTSLTAEQVRGIYTGTIKNWSEVGGADEEIVAYQRNSTSGSQVMMEKVVMNGEAMADAPTTLRADAMAGLVDEIAAYRNEGNAIGYSVYYYVNNMYMQDGIRLMDVDGVTPTNETIGDGSYPFTQPFYVVIRADAPEDSPARQLYNFLTTEDGQALVTEAGYAATTK